MPQRVEQQLDAVDGLERGPGRRPVDQGGPAGRGRHGRRPVDRLTRRTAAAQGDADLARDDEEPAAGHEQSTGQQLLEGAVGAAGGGLAAVAVDVLEHRPGGVAETGQPVGDPVAVTRLGGERAQSAEARTAGADRLHDPGQRTQPRG